MSFIKKVAILILVSIMAVSFCDDPIVDSIAAIENDMDKTFWFNIGCGAGLAGMGIFAVGLAYLMTPQPPAFYFLGKDPDYTTLYTENYKKLGRKFQVKHTIRGCVTGTLTVVVTILVSYYVIYLTVEPFQ